MAGLPAYDLHAPVELKVQLRVDEKVGPAMFKPDPLIPGGYLANSLTLRAMRPDLFVLGDDTDDLSVTFNCTCGREFDLQFWKLCPYCAREPRP